MKNLCIQVCAALLIAATNNATLAQAQPVPQAPAGGAVPVTVDNFNRAESDLVMGPIVKDGGFGKYVHHRQLYPVDAPIVRPNRDTLYSFSIFDLDAGPVTITLPNAGRRFMSLQVIDGDQYTPEVHYGAGRYTFTRDEIGTRYVQLGVRILVDPNDPEDMKEVHALQDAIKVEQPGGPGRFEVPNWDQASQKKVRDALLVLGTTLPDTKRMFGPRDQVDPVRHLIGTAMAYGGNPEKDALYLNITPSKNDGKIVYRLAINGEVPVDDFWSIIVYNDKGFLERNAYNAYSLNSITEKKGVDGSIIIQLGGCDGKIVKLPADHAGLELHGTALSSACRNPQRHMEISGGATVELTRARTGKRAGMCLVMRGTSAKQNLLLMPLGCPAPRQPSHPARPMVAGSPARVAHP